MKYSSEITDWGAEAIGFLKELKYLILFDDGAPPELSEMSILHTKASLQGRIITGDIVIIGEKVFEVTAVGDEVHSTFVGLGHATLNFSGGDTPSLPGHIMLKGDDPLTEEDIQKGVRISIY